MSVRVNQREKQDHVTDDDDTIQEFPFQISGKFSSTDNLDFEPFYYWTG